MPLDPKAETVVAALRNVPEFAHGLVRDLRVRWALEEIGRPYRAELFDAMAPRPDDYREWQPFGQVPAFDDGKVRLFESGAILLHLGERSEALLPADARGRSEAIMWVFAALNSVEMASLPWALFRFLGFAADSPERKFYDDWLNARLGHLEPVLAGREWLAGSFSIADLLMADVLRLVDRFDGLAAHPACRAYVARATTRPAFVKAHADQLAHFAAAD